MRAAPQSRTFWKKPPATLRGPPVHSAGLDTPRSWALRSQKLPYTVVGGTSMNDAQGMRGPRSRNAGGRLRDKRDDTHMGTIEMQYGRDFGVRSDMQLGTYLKRAGVQSLNDLIKSNLGKS